MRREFNVVKCPGSGTTVTRDNKESRHVRCPNCHLRQRVGRNAVKVKIRTHSATWSAKK